MYKKIVRSISLFFAIIMIISTSSFAIDTRASSRIERTATQVKMDTDGNLWVYFSVNAFSIMDDIGASRIAIQRYNGSSWITECTLTPDDEPEMQASNELWHYATIPYSPKYSGYSYRAVVNIYATDSTGTSTKTLTSTPVTT